MQFRELKNLAANFYPAFALDRMISHIRRHALVHWLSWFMAALVAFVAVTKLFGGISPAGSFWSALFSFLPISYFAIYLSAAVWLLFFAGEAFYYSKTANDLVAASDGLGSGLDKKPTLPAIGFEAAVAVLGSLNADLTLGFCRSIFGEVTLARLGISFREAKEFLKTNRMPPPVIVSDTGLISFSVIGSAIFDYDEDFRRFLMAHNVTKKDFVGAADWVEWFSRESRRAERFWWKERLGRISGVGKDWAFGELIELRKFASPIESLPIFSAERNSASYRRTEVISLETILARGRGANAVVVGDTSDGAMEVLVLLGQMILNGTVMPALEHKRVYVLDANVLMAVAKEKSVLETELIKILKEMMAVGNLILVIADLPGFIESAAKIGVDLPALLDGYLVSPEVHIVATASTDAFHKLIEPNQALMKHLEKVNTQGGGEDSIIEILRREAVAIERQSGMFFTYQAIRAAASGASRYFSYGSPAAKATSLLFEVAPAVKMKKERIITGEDISALVRTKTGVPAGRIEAKERQTLMNLEKILAERIVDQDEAVRAIAGAMRRARSGVGNPNRPIGSFLFLGPTGVGKTETTKALSAAFFGNEDAILRLDMSEYRTADALDRLIGSFSLGRPGVLSSMLRDRPYGVLLLDEFEKTSKEVLDLFLQVLDEGFFSDMSGNRVNARNLIIIATSNAGSDLIWQMMSGGQGDNRLDKEAIINGIVNQGTFKPELLNRFDGVIVFRPLSAAGLRTIARLMLKKLAKRLLDRGLELEISDDLIEALVKKGSDPKFGARPMNRAIQDKVEELIAERLIKAEIGSGSKVVFSPEDIARIS
jgi:ATP-dependent Clp protease ATP-binding subunit ClpC